MGTSNLKYPFGRCMNCGVEFNSELRNEYRITHCPYCGLEIDDCFSDIDPSHAEERKDDVYCAGCGGRIYEQSGRLVDRDAGTCLGPCGRELCGQCADWEEGVCNECMGSRDGH